MGFEEVVWAEIIRKEASVATFTKNCVRGQRKGRGACSWQKLEGKWRLWGLFGYPVRRRSQSSWSSTSCWHHPGAGPSELSTPSGPTQPHWGQSGLPALGLTPGWVGFKKRGGGHGLWLRLGQYLIIFDPLTFVFLIER